MASSVIISAPNAVLGIPRDVWGINSGVTEAADSTCSCTGWTFAHGDGVNKVFELPSLVSSLTSLYRRDWQGTWTLSTAARTNRAMNSEDATMWDKYTGVTVAANAAVGPRGDLVADKITYDGTGTAGSYRLRTSAVESYKPASGQAAASSLWMRADSNITVRLYSNLPPGELTTCNLTTTWQRFRTPVGNVGDGVTTLRSFICSASGDNTPWSIYVANAQIEDGSSVTPYIGPTTTAPVTVTDYVASGNTITLAEAPLLGSDLSVDADLVPHTCLSFNHGGRR